MRKAFFVLLATLALSLAANASAQTITSPTRLAVGCLFDQADAAKNLTTHYLAGDPAKFHAHAVALIAKITTAPDCAKVTEQKIDVKKRDVVLLLWVDTDALGKEDVVYHAVVQKDDSDPFGPILPGVAPPRRAFEIFVSAHPKAAVASAYTSTRQRNPLEEQLPALAQAIVDPLAALLASTQGTLRSAPPPAAPPAGAHYATVSQIALPFARAAVHVDIRVAAAPSKDAIETDILNLSIANAFGAGAHSACARTLNTQLKGVMDKMSDACARNPSTCVLAVTVMFRTQFEAAAATCTSDAERKELLAVDASYREFVTGLSSAKVTGAFDLKNSPKRLVSLGLATGFAFGGGVHKATRVKLKDNILIADPLDRRLSLVVVNFGFIPYNADAFHPTAAERFRWFLGAVVTPDFGVAAGLSLGIVRGLAVNVGGAILGVRGLHTDDQLGAASKHPEDPFGLSSAPVMFVGFGYNFK